MKRKINKRKVAILLIILAIIMCFIVLMINKESISSLKSQTQAQKVNSAISVNSKGKNTSNFTYVESLDGIQVPVPKGYVASTEDSEKYVNKTEVDDEIYGGFVIYEGEEDIDDIDDAREERNQYVWVPIADVSDMYHTSGNFLYGNGYTFSASGASKSTSLSTEPGIVTNYDKDNTYLTQYLHGITRYQFLLDMQESFYEMLQSVATYGGFYIGRYETGDLSKDIPVVKRLNTDIASQTWYRMYEKCKRLRGDNDCVETSMIWRIQYDETLKWLLDTEVKTASEIGSDSTSWGNYYNSTFDYTTATGGTATKRTNNSTRIPSGATDYTKANNIYDLAGNVWEWTLEVYGSSNRACRGGYYDYYGYYYPAGYRSGYDPNSSSDGRRLSSSTLY